MDLVHRRLTSGHAVGVDISEEMVAGAAMRFAQAPRGGNVRVLRADVSALPFAASSFDRAYSVNGIFFWPDPAAGLAEIYRVLRPGGFVVIAGPAAAFALARLAGLGQAAPSGPNEVRRIASDAGFSDVQVRRAVGAALISGTRP